MTYGDELLQNISAARYLKTFSIFTFNFSFQFLKRHINRVWRMHIWTLFKTLNEAFAPSDVNPVFSNQISSLLLTFLKSVSKYEHVGRGCFKIM